MVPERVWCCPVGRLNRDAEAVIESPAMVWPKTVKGLEHRYSKTTFVCTDGGLE